MDWSRPIVFVQVSLVFALTILGWEGMATNHLLMAGVILATLLGLHAVFMIKVQHFRVSPQPGEQAELCQRGVFRWVRHPVYSALLCGGGFFAIGAGTWLSLLLWIALASILWVKLLWEERIWEDLDPRYQDYKKRTKRLIPFLL